MPYSKNGGNSFFFFSTFKLTIQASFRITYSRESLSQNEPGKANLNVDKRLLHSPPFLNSVYNGRWR